MDIYLDWLNLGLRWLHIIVGVAWIGASFYFNWLLNRLTQPEEPDPQVQGELWAIHAGGFFRVQKRNMAPGSLPEPLHWFKWEAYWTWLSGFALLVLMYYVQADRYLIDPSVADLEHWQAVAIGLATLFIGTGVYDASWRSPLAYRAPGLLSVIGCVLLGLLAFGLTQVFSGRGAYMHIGALLGTIMVANVAHVIMPSQRELVRATLAGEDPDPKFAVSAGLRSLHNNYLTLPVLFIMISAHYPMTYGHSANWLVLIGLFVCSVFIRHFFNVRWALGDARTMWWLAMGIGGFIGVAVLTNPPVQNDGQQVAFSEVEIIINDRCVACHAVKPTMMPVPGKGVVLDSPDAIVEQAAAIQSQAVLSRAMPLGNVTGMTDAERELLGAWVRSGAGRN
ncbi:MAG: urate hydroxylase PuuD [Pseudomonadota bacterium]